MHEYATNLVDRAKVIAWAMLVGAACFVGLAILLTSTDRNIPVWVGTPSAIGFLGAAFTVYDRWLWRQKVGRFRFSVTPYLGGCWVGSVDVSRQMLRPEEPGEHIPCLVRIRQTWSKISITFETELTTSNSLMALLNDPQGFAGGLRYEFFVQPKPDIRLTDMSRHFGVAWLLPQNDAWDRLAGEFYNGPGFPRHGRYAISRLDAQLSTAAWLDDLEAARSENPGLPA